MQVDNWVFTALDVPVPFEVYSLAFLAQGTANSGASVKVVAAIYEGFQVNGYQYVPWRPMASLAPDGTLKSRFTCDTDVVGSVVTTQNDTRLRVMVRPDPITRDPVILEAGKRYWIAANWDAAPTLVEVLTRTVTSLPRFEGTLDCARTGSQLYSTALEPVEHTLRQMNNEKNGPGEDNVYIAGVPTSAQILAASIDWAICGRRLR